MPEKYKLIDGVLYQSIDTTGFQDLLNRTVEQVRPYKDGIYQCERQIEEYRQQITAIVTNSGLDREVARAIDPTKADFLGL